MRVEVRLLRQAGKPLSREQVAAANPRRGTLAVAKRHDPWRGAWVPYATLVGDDDDDRYLLPPLDQVRIARWQGADLVLIGLEEDPSFKGAEPALQSWWVRLVPGPAPP